MKNTILILFIIGNLIALLNGYYVPHELNGQSNDTETIIQTLVIDHNNNQEISLFPNEFTISLGKVNGEQLNNLKFERVLTTDHDHPIASSDVYTLDSDKKLVKAFNSKLNSFETYRSKNGRGYATLIRNDILSNVDHPFRLIASIHSAKEDVVYDVIPLKKPTKSNTARKSLSDHLLESIAHSLYDASENTHKISKRAALQSPSCGYKSDKIMNKLKRTVQIQRSKRAVNGKPVKVYVELLLTTDKTVYDYHAKLLSSTDKNFIFEMMKVYFSHFYTQVNQEFTNSLRNDPDIRVYLKLKNFIFYTEPTEWTDNTKYGVAAYPTNGGEDPWEVLTLKSLDAFATYMQKNPPPFSYDLAVSMFRKDIWEGETPDTAAVLGVAKSKGACKADNKAFIMEEPGTFLYVSVAAHEAAHTLGVDHDESYPECSQMSGYVMAAGMIPIGAPNPNYGQFSTCSINAFKKNLLTDDLSCIREEFNCLANKPEPVINDVTKDILNTRDACKVYNGNKDSAYCNLPGQVMSPDEQCKWFNGPDHQFYARNANTSCQNLACLNIKTMYFRNIFPALEGTQCGPGKVCLNKQCVENSTISNSDLQCPFPDLEVDIEDLKLGLPKVRYSCDEYLPLYYSKFDPPVYGCTNDYIKNQCCKSCKKYRDYNCSDASWCSMYDSIYCTDPQIKDGCPAKCQTCTKSAVTCKDSTYLCQNGGTCVNNPSNSILGYKCQCPTGYKGFLCEQRDPCALNPCASGQTCKQVGSLEKFICF